MSLWLLSAQRARGRSVTPGAPHAWNVTQHFDATVVALSPSHCTYPVEDLCRHIIKRFDTNAVSASSLFRAAFPTATEDEEAVEMRWIVVGSRGQYGDTAAAGMEHVESKKLSGTWYASRPGLFHRSPSLTALIRSCRIPAKHAHALATEYGILRYARDLIEYAEPSSSSGPGTPNAATAASTRHDDFDDVSLDRRDDRAVLLRPHRVLTRFLLPALAVAGCPFSQVEARTGRLAACYQDLECSSTVRCLGTGRLNLPDPCHVARDRRSDRDDRGQG